MLRRISLSLAFAHTPFRSGYSSRIDVFVFNDLFRGLDARARSQARRIVRALDIFWIVVYPPLRLSHLVLNATALAVWYCREVPPFNMDSQAIGLVWLVSSAAYMVVSRDLSTKTFLPKTKSQQ